PIENVRHLLGRIAYALQLKQIVLIYRDFGIELLRREGAYHASFRVDTLLPSDYSLNSESVRLRS
ncbi:MAG: hypothetical protein MUO58_03355, partial [Anaerolineales bacterium]|nr:hypothetical protein [Anaerolineales bacterium]